jgi:hypothetical protein
MTLKPHRLLTVLSLGTLLYLSQACSESGGTSEVTTPETIEPLVKQAPVGSLLVGVLEESTTTCLTGECSTRISKRTIAKTVGRGSKDLHPVASYAAAAFPRPRDTTFSANGYNFDRRAFQINATRIRDGKHQRVVITADSATGHPLSFEYYENDAVLFTDRSAWDSVSGVWYKKSLEITAYRDGKAVVTKKKTFTPTGITRTAFTSGGMEIISGPRAADCNWDEPCLPMPYEGGSPYYWMDNTELIGSALDASWTAIFYGKNFLNTVITNGINWDGAWNTATDLWYATGVESQGWLTWVGLGLDVIESAPWLVTEALGWLDDAAEWIYTKISNWIHDHIGDPNME